jgi:hypothetical protein
MNSSDKETKIFIHSELLNNEQGVEELRETFNNTTLLNHTIIVGIVDGALKIIPPTPAQQRYTLQNSSFVYFVEQKIMDGYFYGSLYSFKKFLGITV